MALSFAGVQLTVPTPEAAAWVEKNVSLADLYPWDAASRVSSVRVGLTVNGQLDRRRVRLNVLRWPVGACEWATCFLLASTNQLGAVLSAVYESSGLNAGTLLMTGPRGQVSTEMYLLPPRPLAQLPYANGMWLLPLVDARYLWWQATSGDIKTTPPASWQDWISALGNAIGEGIVLSRTTPATYPLPSGPGDLGLSYVDVPPLLDSVAYNIGCRVVRGLDGTVTLQDPLAAAQAQQGLMGQVWPVMAGGRLPLTFPSTSGSQGLQWWQPQDNPGNYPQWNPPGWGTSAGVVPSQVEITFPRTDDPTTLVTLECSPSGTGAPDLVNLGTGPGTKTLRSGIDATFSGSTWTNQSTLQAFVDQFATDWFRWQLSQLDIVFDGIIPWTPEALDDVEWAYRTDGVATRVVRLPYNDRYEELLHDTSPASGSSGPQPTLNLTLPSASNSDVDIGGLSGGYKWVRVTSSPASPSTIDGFAGGQDGVLIEVTNCTTNDLNIADQAHSGSATANQILVPENQPPAGNTGEPYFRTLHERESLFLKYDGTAQRWRVLERLTHLLVGTSPSTGTEYARGRIQLIPACHMAVSAADDPTTDTVQVTIGTNGKTVNYTVTAGDVLTFVCGQLTAVNGV